MVDSGLKLAEICTCCKVVPLVPIPTDHGNFVVCPSCDRYHEQVGGFRSFD